jgi:hypothetical protein
MGKLKRQNNAIKAKKRKEDIANKPPKIKKEKTPEEKAKREARILAKKEKQAKAKEEEENIKATYPETVKTMMHAKWPALFKKHLGLVGSHIKA